jgi:hypothetical protein
MNPEQYASGTIDPQSGEADHTDTFISLRARDPDSGGLLADTEEEHIKLTFDGLITVDDPLSATGNAPGQLSGTITAKHDGTNAPVVIALNEALEEV